MGEAAGHLGALRRNSVFEIGSTHTAPTASGDRLARITNRSMPLARGRDPLDHHRPMTEGFQARNAPPIKPMFYLTPPPRKLARAARIACRVGIFPLSASVAVLTERVMMFTHLPLPPIGDARRYIPVDGAEGGTGSFADHCRSRVGSGRILPSAGRSRRGCPVKRRYSSS
jgi:hypothetical protein